LLQLKELSDLVLDFDIEAIGFEPPEIDLRIQSLDSALEEADDWFELATGPVVSRTGDLWLLGSHRTALTRSGARKASEIVMLIWRTLHFCRVAIC
jgi:hypothetical protein